MSTPRELAEYLFSIGKDHQESDDFFRVLKENADKGDPLAQEALGLSKKRNSAARTRFSIDSIIGREHKRTG